jgi:surfeit locus 1 family protein
MAKFHRLYNIDSASVAYIERLVPSYDSEGEELYPVPSTKDNFEKPYLTP